ncbi:MAG: hypothetical protein LLF94_05000, partial [Chlamydiales bacterium]|nr:hypothetical protein [Chlamydiales bacterium]
YNQTSQAADLYSQGKFTEAQNLLVSAKQNIDAANALSKQQGKPLNISTYIDGANLSLAQGDKKAAKSFIQPALYANNGQVTGADTDIKIAEAYEIAASISDNKDQQERFTQYSKSRMAMAKQKEDDENYKGWVEYLRDPNFSLHLMENIVNPTGEMRGIYEGVKRVGEGVIESSVGAVEGVAKGEIKSLGQLGKQELKSALDIVIGAAHTYFSASMLMQWGTAPIIPAAFTIANALTPELSQKIMMPATTVAKDVYGKDIEQLSDIQKGFLELGDIVGMLVLFEGAKTGVKYVGKKTGEIPIGDQTVMSKLGGISKKIFNKEPLTDTEVKTATEILEKATDENIVEPIKATILSKEQAINPKVEPIISEQPTGKIEVPKEDVKPTDEQLVREIKDKQKQSQLKKQDEPPLPTTESTDANRKDWNDADYENKINQLEAERDTDGNKIKKDKEILSVEEQKELDDSNKFYNDKIKEYKKERADRLQSEVKPVTETPVEAEVKPVEKTETAVTDVSALRDANTKEEIDNAIKRATQDSDIKDALQTAENIIGRPMAKSLYYSDAKKFANDLADAIDKIKSKEPANENVPLTNEGNKVEPIEPVAEKPTETKTTNENITELGSKTNKIPFDKTIEPVTQTKSGKAKTFSQMSKDFVDGVQKAVRYIKPKRSGMAGSYNPSNGLISMRRANNLHVLIHEMAHYLDDFYTLFTDNKYDSELSKYWDRGSEPPKGYKDAERYKRNEGFAEFMVDYVMRPEQTKTDSPMLFDLYDKSFNKQHKTAIEQLGVDVRTFGNLPALEQISSNVKQVELEKKTLQKLKDAVKEITKSLTNVQSFTTKWLNPNYPVERAFKRLMEANNVKALVGRSNFN